MKKAFLHHGTSGWYRMVHAGLFTFPLMNMLLASSFYRLVVNFAACSPGPVCCDNDYWSSSEEILSCHDIMVMAQYAPCWQIEANNGRDMNVETRNGQRGSYCEVKSQSEGSDRNNRPIRGSQCDTWQVWHDSSVTQWSTQVWWHAPPLIQIHREYIEKCLFDLLFHFKEK